RGACFFRVHHADQLIEANSRNQLHAEQPLVEIGVYLLGKDLHDVLMLEPRHRAPFAAAIGGNLERDEPIERNLAGEIHMAERTAAKHADDLEIVDLRPRQERHRRFTARLRRLALDLNRWRLIGWYRRRLQRRRSAQWLRLAKTWRTHCCRLSQNNIGHV